MSQLDDSYFRLVYTEDATPNHAVKYQIYRPAISTMILFSKVNGAPLAGVSLMTWGSGHGAVTSRAVILKRPSANNSAVQVDFQGLIDEDDQKFEFILTNFSSSGVVKIDIMKKNVAVQDTDPGSEKGGLNNVNEISPFQSYSIRGDQKDSRALVLSSIKTMGGGNITVKEAEKSPQAPMGTYYWIAATPRDNSPELIKLFAETYWDCVDFLVVPQVKQPITKYDEEDEEEESQGRNEGPVMRLASYDGPIPAAGPPQPRGGHAESRSKGIQPMSARRDEGYAQIASLSTASIPKRSKTESFKGVIDDSLAANVESGELVDTRGNKTGYSYFYDVPSNQTGKLCCLGLSVALGLKFNPLMPLTEILHAGRLLIADLKIKGAQALIRNIKVFPHDHCVICLDDETKPDMIFCQCGHSCCCSNCAGKLKDSKCPMCRGYISAMIKNPVS